MEEIISHWEGNSAVNWRQSKEGALVSRESIQQALSSNTSALAQRTLAVMGLLWDTFPGESSPSQTLSHEPVSRGGSLVLGSVFFL